MFDLKGSVRSRLVRDPRAHQTLMDENLIQELYESPICVDEHTKAELTIAVWNDTLFLSDLNVMDYSLITGINDNNEVVVGIIGTQHALALVCGIWLWLRSHDVGGASMRRLHAPIHVGQATRDMGQVGAPDQREGQGTDCDLATAVQTPLPRCDVELFRDGALEENARAEHLDVGRRSRDGGRCRGQVARLSQFPLSIYY